MQMAALLWHLRLLSDQPIVVSGIGMARFVPILLFAPIGGVIADSFNRRKVLFITQTVMIIAAGLLGILTWLGIIQIWHIYVLSAVQAIATAFDSPSRQSIVPHLVPKHDLTNAFSLQSIASNTGAIIGPALSGVVIGFWGMQYVYLINASTFLAVLSALFLMGPIAQETRPAVHGIRASLLSVREGAEFILHQPIILSSMLLDFVATFFSSATTLLPFVARDILKVGEVAYGWLVASQSIGGVLVGLFMSQRTNIHRQGKLLMASVLAFGAATALLGVSRTMLFAMLTLALIGAADAVSTILRNTIRQLQTPDYIRGRMVSLNQVFFMGGPQLGEVEAGAAAQIFGIQGAIITGGIGCILGALWIGARFPQLVRYTSPVSVAEPLPAD